MNVAQYLTRFHATKKEPSLEHLKELQNLHLQGVPFENLDVIRHRPIYLNLNSIYEKIVLRNRGGFCYELNGLFCALLQKLGYDAHLISATVLKPNGEWAKADTHATILVHFNEPYLVDVGFGANTPRLPIPLNGQAQTAINGIYKIKQHCIKQFDLMHENDKTLYRFTTPKKELIDFHEGSVFNQVSKESTFTHQDIVTCATETGRITLTDHTFSIYNYDQQKRIELSADEKTQVLDNFFEICLDQ